MAEPRQAADPDPVIEAYKQNVDRSLLIQNLRRTPEERLRAMISMLELAAELREAVRRGAREPAR